MEGMTVLKKRRPRLVTLISLAAILGLLLGSAGFASALASSPFPVTPSQLLASTGYLDFSYQVVGQNPTPDGTNWDVSHPSGEKPESKLWWNDGFWWGVLYESTTRATYIYYLDWGTQTWVNTGVKVDDRADTRADTLWDQANNKLYILSHRYTMNSTSVDTSDNSGWLYRYTYNASLQTYTLDTPAALRVTRDKTESMVIDKDSTGRLWVAFVSRPAQPQGNLDYSVMVTYSDNDGVDWRRASSTLGISIALPFPEAHVSVDDIASLIVFGSGANEKVGVMWSNGNTPDSFLFAVHDISNPDPNAWTLEKVTSFQDSLGTPIHADDHMNLKKTSDGRVFAAVKGQTADPSAPIIALLVRDPGGSWSSYTYSLRGNTDNQQNTQPTMLIDESANLIYLFVSDKEGGRRICYKTTSLSSPAEFDQSTECGTPFIADSKYINIDKATSTKSNVNSTTGIVVLATNETVDQSGALVEQFYTHNVMGNPPAVITDRYPDINSTDAALDTAIKVTFSKDMKASTIAGTANITLKQGNTTINGALTYDAASRTAIFTPDVPLTQLTQYTVTVTTAVKDSNNQPLYSSQANTWTFTTSNIVETPPVVSFSVANDSVPESPTSVKNITVTLDKASTNDVTVDYVISDGSATAPSDYSVAAATGTLTIPHGATSANIPVTILDDPLNEGDEFLTLLLKNPTNALLGGLSASTLTITDNDPLPAAQFAKTSYDVNGNDGKVSVDLALSNPSGQAVTIYWSTSDGVTGSVDVPVGSTSAKINLEQLRRTVDLSLTSADHATIGDPSTTNLKVTYTTYIPLNLRNFRYRKP